MKRIKQFGCLVLAMVCFCIAFVMPAHAFYDPFYDDQCPKVDFAVGDVIYNGRVDAVDALWVLLRIAWIDSQCQKTGRDPIIWRLCFQPTPSKKLSSLPLEYEDCYYTYFLGERPKGFSSLGGWTCADVRLIIHKNNQSYLGDVDGDKTLTAKDALLILQYAVGKIDAFPRTSLTDDWDKYWAFGVWPDDWRPGMYGETFRYRNYPDCYTKLPPENLPWDFYDPANWTYLPGYYEEYILPLKEANEG